MRRLAIGIGIAITAATVGCASGTAPAMHDDTTATRLPVAARAELSAQDHQVATTASHLTYYGGPVLQSARVVAVFWNDKVASAAKLPAFYTWLVSSPYLGWQTEYDSTTPPQAIGSGAFVKSVVDTKAPAATSLKDADIQKELGRMLDAGEVPATDANTLYMVHFPPGVSVDLNGSTSCIEFCGYHAAFVHNAKNVYYGVVPDQGGACLGGCGDDADPFNNLTAQCAHEFIETVTDPAGSLATGNAAPRAWYDVQNGENADICNGQQQKVGAYVVQKAWSNKYASCIAVPPSP